MPFPGQKATQTECLILGNGPSLVDRPFHDVPRERVFVLGVNQSWRVMPDADAHVAIDLDQYFFDDRNMSGYGGRPYYEAHAQRGTLLHPHQSGEWFGKGVRIDRHDAVVFGRRPFQRRHRDGNAPAPPLEMDGGFALKTNPANTAGSTVYVALQLAAAAGFQRVWLVGLDMGANAVKFDGARGYSDRKKAVCVDRRAWSNSEKHDSLWRCVPPDVKEKTFVIAPSATQVLTVVPWPWRGAVAEC